jgi:hypothetical protein
MRVEPGQPVLVDHFLRVINWDETRLQTVSQLLTFLVGALEVHNRQSSTAMIRHPASLALPPAAVVLTVMVLRLMQTLPM